MRIAHVWHQLRHSFWFIPSLITLAAAVLSQITLIMDETMNWENYNGLGWIYSGGGESASTLLSAIVGSMITATSVTFSMTLVALSLTASQYGPRLLQNFMGRPGSQIVLGTFLATFIFSLLVLRSVRITDHTTVVPHLSVTVAIGLALTSVGVLIFFIHHIAKSIQADTIIGQVYSNLIDAIDRMFPEQTKKESSPAQSPTERSRASDEAVRTSAGHEDISVCARATGYVQTINVDGLLEFAAKQDLVITLHCRPGQFLVEGQHVATLYSAHSNMKELPQYVGDQLTLGQERTSEQDIGFAILQLVEVAMRALSPGINDPHTAIRCVDWLGAALCRLSQYDLPDPHRHDEKGNLRVVINPDSLEEFFDAAFDQIRRASAGKPVLYNRLLESMTMIALLMKSSPSHHALQRHAETVMSDARHTIEGTHDRFTVEKRYHAFLEAISQRNASASV